MVSVAGGRADTVGMEVATTTRSCGPTGRWIAAAGEEVGVATFEVARVSWRAVGEGAIAGMEREEVQKISRRKSREEGSMGPERVAKGKMDS